MGGFATATVMVAPAASVTRAGGVARVSTVGVQLATVKVPLLPGVAAPLMVTCAPGAAYGNTPGAVMVSVLPVLEMAMVALVVTSLPCVICVSTVSTRGPGPAVGAVALVRTRFGSTMVLVWAVTGCVYARRACRRV